MFTIPSSGQSAFPTICWGNTRVIWLWHHNCNYDVIAVTVLQLSKEMSVNVFLGAAGCPWVNLQDEASNNEAKQNCSNKIDNWRDSGCLVHVGELRLWYHGVCSRWLSQMHTFILNMQQTLVWQDRTGITLVSVSLGLWPRNWAQLKLHLQQHMMKRTARSCYAGRSC